MRITKLAIIAAAATAMLHTTDADAALNAYLRLKGKESGDVRGSGTQKGREGKIMVIAAHHERGAETKGPGTFTITKEVDRSSPVLFKAHMKGDHFSEWELQFWQRSPSGLELQHYTVKLVDARITSIKFWLPNTRDPAQASAPELEEITFSYQRISLTWNEGGITSGELP